MDAFSIRNSSGALLLLCCSASFALPTQNFQVSANIVAGCLISGTNTGVFGQISFGSYSALSTATLNASYVQSSTITLACTPGTSLSMSIDGGSHYTATRNMNVSGTSHLVPYNVYNSSTNTAIPVNQAVALTFSNANNITLPLYGMLTLNGNNYAGNYTDTLTVTLSW